jgi:Fe-S-cluster containining protein
MVVTDDTVRLLEARHGEILARVDVGHRRLVAELADRIIAHNGRMTGLGRQASKFCTSGCARCCAMLFFVSPAEVEVIAFHLLERPELLSSFLAASREREGRLAPHEELWRRCQAATHADDPALKAFYRLDIRCACNVAGSCSIYPVRPLSCALYNSIVPAAVCAVEPKAYETEEMRLHHGETRQWLARNARRIVPRDGLRLDVSRRVLLRLGELVTS